MTVENVDLWASGSPFSGHEDSVDRGSVGGVSVFCVDPGETTGWCWAMVGHHELLGSSRSSGVADAVGIHRAVKGAAVTGRLVHGEINTWDEARMIGRQGSLFHGEAALVNRLMLRIAQADAASTRKLGRPFQVTHVVVEDFDLRSSVKNRNLLSPVRITSGLFNELHSADESIHLHLQTPSDKSVISDTDLQRHGLWFKGQQHARDAARHLLLFLRRYTI